MNRRAFLTALLGSVAAGVVLEKGNAVASNTQGQPNSIAAWEAHEARAWESAYHEVHREADRLFRAAMLREGHQEPRLCTDTAYRLGDNIYPGGQRVTEMCGVTIDEEQVQQGLQVAIAALAQRVSRVGIDLFVPMELPQAVAYAGHANTLRMIAAFDPVVGMLVRFDVAGALSPAAQERVRRLRIAEQKQAIRQNIRHHQGLAPGRLPA